MPEDLSVFSKRLPLFPISVDLQSNGQQSTLTIAGLSLAELALLYGTPLYIYDRATLDASLKQYQQALARHYPGPSAITYAGKAFLCTAIAQWADQMGLWLDCTGAGELNIALHAKVERGRLLIHGVNKTKTDLQACILHAGTIVVDNLSELENLARLYHHTQGDSHPPLPAIWLRLRPGTPVDTHHYTQTGQPDSKFGMSPDEILQAVQLSQHTRLPLVGLHFHLGSQFHDPEPLTQALEVTLNLVQTCREQTGWLPQVLCPGGGWGVPYHEDDLPHPPIETYVAHVAEQVIAGCMARNLPLPYLQLEPGRSLIAQAGVAIYQVGAVKQTIQRRWLLLDGGLADNPRPALYQARYTALPVINPTQPAEYTYWLAGPYCESGDILIEALPLPEVNPGDWIAVPVSGAYQLSMGSNYNGARKPAVLWLDRGEAHLIQVRETFDELFSRDRSLPG